MTLLSTTKESIEASGLGDDPQYAAACELAKKYAQTIDRGIRAGGVDASKALYLGPHLQKLLTELGLMPEQPERRGPGRPRNPVPTTRPGEGSKEGPEGEEEQPDELASARERHARRRA